MINFHVEEAIDQRRRDLTSRIFARDEQKAGTSRDHANTKVSRWESDGPADCSLAGATKSEARTAKDAVDGREKEPSRHVGVFLDHDGMSTKPSA